MERAVCPLVALASLLALPAVAAASGRVEILGGSAYNFETTLTIRQDGFPELRHPGRYSTKPLTGAPYIAGRLGWWKGSSGWEAQIIHHKLYLEDPEPPVERLEISHGYSFVTLQRAGAVRGWEWRVGAGAVVVHPESTIRRMTHVTGYGLTGPCGLIGLGRRWSIGPHLVLSAEAQLSAARARVRVGGGTADAPNVALHGLVGVGYGF